MNFAKKMAAVALMATVVAPVGVFAQAKSCDDLKAEIAKKIEANGVKDYTLDVVDKDATTDAKVVGTCGGGTKKIVYTRGAAVATPAPASAPAK
jgi:hypothetical protein